MIDGWRYSFLFATQPVDQLDVVIRYTIINNQLYFDGQFLIKKKFKVFCYNENIIAE